MNNLKLKTNIKCAACVAKVTPYLDNAVGKDAWEVDISNPNKVLTIKEEVDAELVKEALRQAGYKGEEA